MKTYIVKTKQNIFDIALQLHGSIEGVFDLLLSNEALTFDTVIAVGTELSYHEEFVVNGDIVTWLEDNHVVVRNGQKVIEAVQQNLPRVIIVQHGLDSVLALSLSSGNLIIDWGDTSTPQTFSVSDGDIEAIHNYGSNTYHIVRLYGDFSFSELNLSGINGIYYLLDTVNVGTLIDSHGIPELQTLFQTV